MDQAEDLVGETILRVVQAGKVAESIRYYYTAARTLLVDRRRVFMFGRMVQTVELIDVFAVDDMYFEDDDGGVLAPLSSIDQQIVQRRAAGLRYEEIGNELGLTRAQVYLRRKHIREAMSSVPVSQQETTGVYGCRSGPCSKGREDAERHERAAVA